MPTHECLYLLDPETLQPLPCSICNVPLPEELRLDREVEPECQSGKCQHGTCLSLRD